MFILPYRAKAGVETLSAHREEELIGPAGTEWLLERALARCLRT